LCEINLRGTPRLLAEALSCPSASGAETNLAGSILTYLLSALEKGLFTDAFEQNCGVLEQLFTLLWGPAPDDDPMTLAADIEIARSVEENHRARMLIDGGLMRYFLDVEVEGRARGQVNDFVCMWPPSKKFSIQARFSETARMVPAASLIVAIASSPPGILFVMIGIRLVGQHCLRVTDRLTRCRAR
jgi:hypothetical protein